MTFDWDQHNRSKVEAHGITHEAFEQVVSDPNSTTLLQPHKDESRWMTVGVAAGKRIVAIWTFAAKPYGLLLRGLNQDRGNAYEDTKV